MMQSPPIPTNVKATNDIREFEPPCGLCVDVFDKILTCLSLEELCSRLSCVNSRYRDFVMHPNRTWWHHRMIRIVYDAKRASRADTMLYWAPRVRRVILAMNFDSIEEMMNARAWYHVHLEQDEPNDEFPDASSVTSSLSTTTLTQHGNDVDRVSPVPDATIATEPGDDMSGIASTVALVTTLPTEPLHSDDLSVSPQESCPQHDVVVMNSDVIVTTTTTEITTEQHIMTEAPSSENTHSQHHAHKTAADGDPTRNTLGEARSHIRQLRQSLRKAHLKNDRLYCENMKYAAMCAIHTFLSIAAISQVEVLVVDNLRLFFSLTYYPWKRLHTVRILYGDSAIVTRAQDYFFYAQQEEDNSPPSSDHDSVVNNMPKTVRNTIAAASLSFASSHRGLFSNCSHRDTQEEHTRLCHHWSTVRHVECIHASASMLDFLPYCFQLETLTCYHSNLSSMLLLPVIQTNAGTLCTLHVGVNPQCVAKHHDSWLQVLRLCKHLRACTVPWACHGHYSSYVGNRYYPSNYLESVMSIYNSWMDDGPLPRTTHNDYLDDDDDAPSCTITNHNCVHPCPVGCFAMDADATTIPSLRGITKTSSPRSLFPVEWYICMGQDLSLMKPNPHARIVRLGNSRLEYDVMPPFGNPGSVCFKQIAHTFPRVQHLYLEGPNTAWNVRSWSCLATCDALQSLTIRTCVVDEIDQSHEEEQDSLVQDNISWIDNDQETSALSVLPSTSIIHQQGHGNNDDALHQTMPLSRFLANAPYSKMFVSHVSYLHLVIYDNVLYKGNDVVWITFLNRIASHCPHVRHLIVEMDTEIEEDTKDDDSIHDDHFMDTAVRDSHLFPPDSTTNHDDCSTATMDSITMNKEEATTCANTLRKSPSQRDRRIFPLSFLVHIMHRFPQLERLELLRIERLGITYGRLPLHYAFRTPQFLRIDTTCPNHIPAIMACLFHGTNLHVYQQHQSKHVLTQDEMYKDTIPCHHVRREYLRLCQSMSQQDVIEMRRLMQQCTSLYPIIHRYKMNLTHNKSHDDDLLLQDFIL